jgi:hypothetical protein
LRTSRPQWIHEISEPVTIANNGLAIDRRIGRESFGSGTDQRIAVGPIVAAAGEPQWPSGTVAPTERGRLITCG